MNEHSAQDPRFGATSATVAFVGDSITASGDWVNWFPELNTLNHGVSGDTTDDLIERLSALIDARPDEIVLLIGTNDLGRRLTVEHLVRNIQLMLVELRRQLPGCRMLLQSIMPRGKAFAVQIQEANIHLRQFAATVHAQYLDLWPALVGEDGEIDPAYSGDQLHLNDAGYAAWLAELRPAFERLREQPPMSAPLRIVG